jgi:DNA polymerase-3 subunit gamma/tau
VSYRVFARKYRPQTFDEVVGQEHITRTLMNAISSGRVAQAYLFVGPRGIGKTSTARILAKALNCENGPTATPCGTCVACQEIAEGRSLDVLEIDGASNNGVENIRELRENASYAPARGPYKIYLIDEVHMLSTGAFNALLKTLEEPPEHVKFIFATTEAQKVPATITSRCQRFDLRRIPDASISSHMLTIAEKEGIALEPAAADAIARGADGGLRDAESMLDQAVAFCGKTITATDIMDVFGFTSLEVVSSLLDSIFVCDTANALAVISEQATAGKDLSRLLGDLISRLRDLLVAEAQSVGAAGVPRAKLLALLDHLAETEARMRWATDKKLQLDVAAIKAVHLLEQASLDDVIEALSALQRGEALPVAPVRPKPTTSVTTRPAAPPTPAPAAAPAPAPVVQKPAPAPVVAEPPPAPKPVEPPPASTVEEQEEETDIAVFWGKVASSFASSIGNRWISTGVFESANSDDTVLVHVPPSGKEGLESFVGEKGRKEAEAKLSQLTGRRIKLVIEVSTALPDPTVEPDPEPEPEIIEEKAPEPAPQPVADVNPAEDFKNDPLIKKALEIFRSEIQTATP